MLDPALPEWGDSRYVDLRLTGAMRVADALSHLYVLIPVLDGDKHYWVNEDEVDKLLRRGGTWLADHPLKDWIVSLRPGRLAARPHQGREFHGDHRRRCVRIGARGRD